jgi:putative photosynthetic complex assembly protein 2
MHNYLLPALFALFMWWFSTGLIIFLDGLPRRTFKWSLAGATALLALSLYGLAVSSRAATPAAAYWAFACGLFAWGWQEISFYMGFVTGPRRQPCPEGCAGWRHFVHAIETSLWHELAIIVAAASVVALIWNAPNKVGLWTFMILWWMHQSAKLNVFLGVRNLNEEFIPEHLAFLKSFLTKRPMNLLFPVSVTASTAIATLLARNAIAAGADAFQAISLTFLATMMALAILEHWFLVIPLPAGKLWQWGLASRRPAQSFDATLVVGFLGAGKTTLMRRLLADADPAVRTVVLVNDFAAGIDGSLLSGQGADVIELPNGCICCSLRGDLERQITEMIARWAPRKVLIEPSGVADVAALVAVLHGPALRPLIRRLSVLGVIDAGAFLADYARMPEYFAAQARLAERIIVNKCDLVQPAELRMVGQTLRGLNPEVALIAASFGVERPEPLQVAAARAEHNEHAHPAVHDCQHHHSHDHEHEHVLSGLTSWSAPLYGACRADDLEDLLAAIVRGEFGAVARVKGLARVGAGWVRFDVAGGRSRMAAFAASDGEEPRVVAIGCDVNKSGLSAAFAACALAEAA